MRKFKVITHNSDWSDEQAEELTAIQFYDRYCVNSSNLTLKYIHGLLFATNSNSTDTLSLVYHDISAAKRYTIISTIN